MTLHGKRNGFQLNCGGLGEAQVFHGLDQFGGQAQSQEAVRSLFNSFNHLNSLSGLGCLDNVLRHLGGVIGKIFDKR